MGGLDFRSAAAIDDAKPGEGTGLPVGPCTARAKARSRNGRATSVSTIGRSNTAGGSASIRSGTGSSDGSSVSSSSANPARQISSYS